MRGPGCISFESGLRVISFPTFGCNFSYQNNQIIVLHTAVEVTLQCRVNSADARYVAGDIVPQAIERV